MTPEAAVAQLVHILSTRAEFNEEQVFAALEAASVPFPIAERAYKFTQIAWGHQFLDGTGIKFSPYYLCFNASGEVIESGEVATQPYFTSAMAAAQSHPPPVSLPRFALMSADVRALNDALKAGSNPENLVMGPAGLFMEPPTPAGIERARQLLSEHLPDPLRPPHRMVFAMRIIWISMLLLMALGLYLLLRALGIPFRW